MFSTELQQVTTLLITYSHRSHLRHSSRMQNSWIGIRNGSGIFIKTEILSVDGGNLKLRTRLHGLFTDSCICSASYYKIHFQIISQSITATSEKYIPFGLSDRTLG